MGPLCCRYCVSICTLCCFLRQIQSESLFIQCHCLVCLLCECISHCIYVCIHLFCFFLPVLLTSLLPLPLSLLPVLLTYLPPLSVLPFFLNSLPVRLTYLLPPPLSVYTACSPPPPLPSPSPRKMRLPNARRRMSPHRTTLSQRRRSQRRRSQRRRSQRRGSQRRGSQAREERRKRKIPLPNREKTPS